MYNFSDFVNRISKSRGFVCYGVGKYFRIFEKYFKGTGLVSKLEFCIDKNEKVQNSSILFAGKSVEVKSVEALNNYDRNNKVLLITNSYYLDIREELKQSGLLEGIDCYCFAIIYGQILDEEAMDRCIPKAFRLENVQKIPKIIHYFWFGRSQIPEKNKKWMESWRKYCPDYEIVEWNEDNYDITKNKYMYEAYQSKKWGFVPDFARLDVIYRYGGIYLDTDVELVANLDDLLYQDGFVGFDCGNMISTGSGFGAVPGLPIIGIMRDEYLNRHFINMDGTLNLTTSTDYQTACLKEYGLNCNGEYQNIEGLTVYPAKVMDGKSFYSRQVRLKEYTKAIHHYDASWSLEARRKFRSLEKELNN